MGAGLDIVDALGHGAASVGPTQAANDSKHENTGGEETLQKGPSRGCV